MQLLALALYHRDGRPTPRVVRFRPGALNILTGESETGKSEILDIVDYCLGRSTPNLPDEPIDQTVGWYALLVAFRDSRMLLARPRPAGASTTQAIIRTGGDTLDLPRADELTPNSNVAALTQWFDHRRRRRLPPLNARHAARAGPSEGLGLFRWRVASSGSETRPCGGIPVERLGVEAQSCPYA
jgi:hypothetical protein